MSTARPGVELSGTVRRGGFVLSFDLDLAPGVTMISGPNGAGKTTFLRLVAGLDALDSGVLRIAGTVLDQPASGVFIPAHERPIAMAFQDHRLFDHLTVEDNVAFALRRHGVSRHEARSRAAAQIEAMGLAAFATQRPSRLSIGQRQRCALARALTTPADVLLLDEPLASIDDPSRAAMRAHLRAGDFPTILWVTHDPLDMADGGPVISVDTGVVRQTLGR